MACSRLLKSWAIPPAICPSAVSFSDWCICASSSRWAVVSRTIASMPSMVPSRPVSDERVTARLSACPSSCLLVTSNALTGCSRTARRAPRGTAPPAADRVIRRPIASWRHPSEDAAGGRVPALNPALGVQRDDRVARGTNQPFERLLGLRHLAVQAGVTDGHHERFGEHLEQLALAWIDRARACPVGGDEVPKRDGIVGDRAHDRRAGGDAVGHRLTQVHRDLVVAERVAELCGDRRGELGEVELAENAPGDLTQDRELGDAERLLGLLPPSIFLEPARLGGQRTHLVDQGGELGARTELGLAARERASGRFLEILAAEGLDQVLEGPVCQRVLHRLEGRVRRDHHDFDAGVGALDALQELDAVHLRHLDVHEHEVRVKGGQRLQRRLAAVGRGDVVARFQDHAQGLARSQLVVDDEHAGAVGRAHARAAIRAAVKLTSPRPCLASSRPPCASTMRWLTQGPTSMRFS